MAQRLSRRFVRPAARGLAWPPCCRRPSPAQRGRAAADRRLVPSPGSRARPGSGRRLARQPGPGARAGRAPAGAGPRGHRLGIRRLGDGAGRGGAHRPARRSPSCCWPTAPSRRCSRRRCSASSTSSARSSRRVPGIQGILGPHGITLLAHARAGGADAAAVVSYLEGVGGADVRTTTQPLAPADRDAVVGRYRFGPGPRDHFDVDVQQRSAGHRPPEATRAESCCTPATWCSSRPACRR